MLKVEDNIYYIKDEFYTTEAPKLLKKIIPHSFTLMVRVSPLVGGKQIQRKKKFKFKSDECSMLDAVKSIRSVPDEMKRKLVDGTDGKTRIMLINDIWDDFINYKQTTTTGKPWRYSTVKSNMSVYNKWIRNSRLGKMNIEVVKRRHIMELIESVESLNTRNALLTMLRPSIARYFELEEIDRLNPANITGLKQAEPKPHTRLTIKQAGKLYSKMLDTNNLALRNASVLIWQGRRLNEAITLSYSSVFSNLDTKEQYYTVTAENSKTKVDTTYRLPKELCVTLEHNTTSTYTEQSRNEYCDMYNSETHKSSEHDTEYCDITSTCSKSSDVWVCPSRFKGKPHITKMVVRDGYKRALKELGMPNMRLHDIRQIISSILQEAEVPLEIIAMVLGHAGRGIVTKRYTGHSPDVAYKAYMLFMNLITGVVGEDTKWFSYT